MRTINHSIIHEAQTALHDLSFPVELNSLYDANTRAAVRVMQAARSLEPTGELDAVTIEAINDSAGHLRAARSRPAAAPASYCLSPRRHPEPVQGLYREDTIRGAVALTFDDGPSPLYTKRILRILGSAGITATFYVQGSLAAFQPDLIRKIAKEHRLGNHSWDHPALTESPDHQVADQILSTAEVLRELVSGGSRFGFRPPFGIPFFTNTPTYGALWRRFGQVIASTDHDLVMWQIDTHDWKYPANPELIVARFRVELSRVSGGVILMHDIWPQTVFALPGILDVIRRQELPIVSVEDLLRIKYAR
jgi:peptidoglycan/xylan/chitin deacetylase (PgdA/CDA1 family)